MRQGHDNGLITTKGKKGKKSPKLLGINLGADFCAEHEWGIKDIKNALGLDSSKVGVEARRVRNIPTEGHERLEWVQTKEFFGFCLMTNCYSGHINTDYLLRSVRFYNSSLWTAWDQGSFGVFSNDPAIIEQLQEIYDNLRNKNAVVWLGGGGVFQNAGLCIGITDRLPPDVAKQWKEADEDRNAAQKYMEKSGIEKILRDAGKEYFALSPRKMSDGSFKFWLNPDNQRDYDSNWFTLEELKLWAQDKGPVILKKKRRY